MGRIVSCPDVEYTKFFERVRERARKSNKWLERNRWVEPIGFARQKKYDQETDRLRVEMKVDERKIS